MYSIKVVCVKFVHYLHELCRIDEVVLQHLLSETTHGAVKLICCLTVLYPPEERGSERTKDGFIIWFKPSEMWDARKKLISDFYLCQNLSTVLAEYFITLNTLLQMVDFYFEN